MDMRIIFDGTLDAHKYVNDIAAKILSTHVGGFPFPPGPVDSR